MEEWQEEPKNQRHASTPGAELAAQREALGLTVEQIADQLKLAQRQVLAIEQGDYDALPNMAVTRGFIRAYAKAVRLDPAPLVAMIEVEGAVGHATATVRPTKVTASFSESRFPTLTERQGKPVGAIIGGIAVLAVLAAAGAWKAGLISPATFGAHGTAPAATDAGGAAPGAASAPLATQPANQPGSEPAPLQSTNVPLISVPPQPGSTTAPDVVPGGGVNPAPAPGAAPAGAQPAAPGTQTAPANAPVTAPAAPAGAKPGTTPPAAAQPAAPGAVTPAVAGAALAPATPVVAAPAAHEGGGKLVLNVKEDSWVEIRRPGSSSLIARLVKAGNTETFDVRAKDLVIVGKPAGVQATLAGAPLELPQVAGGTIARVNIK